MPIPKKPPRAFCIRCAGAGDTTSAQSTAAMIAVLIAPPLRVLLALRYSFILFHTKVTKTTKATKAGAREPRRKIKYHFLNFTTTYSSTGLRCLRYLRVENV